MFKFPSRKPKQEDYWAIKEREAQEDYEASIALQSMKKESDKAIAEHKTDKPAFVIRMMRDGTFKPEKLEIYTNLFPYSAVHYYIQPPRVRIKTSNPFEVVEEYFPIDSSFPTKEEAAQSIINYTNSGMVVSEYDYPPLKPRT